MTSKKSTQADVPGPPKTTQRLLRKGVASKSGAIRLRVIQPSNSSTTKVFSTAQILIGRGADCDVVLEDENASRVHAEISFAGDQYFIKDRDSLNGIRLNGEMVIDAAVHPGDLIQIGRCEIQILGEGTERLKRESSSSEVLVRPDGIGGVLEVIRAIDIDKVMTEKAPAQQSLAMDSAGEESDEIRNAAQRVNRAYTNLVTIMNLVSKIGSYSHPDQVCEQFVTALKKVFPLVENVAVVEFASDQTESLRFVYQEGFQSNLMSKLHPSLTVLKRVREELKAVYAVDARKDPRFEKSESVLVRGVRSMMCTPIMIRGEARGAIYVENLTQPYCFGQFDLNFLTIFAFHLGTALETSRLLGERDRAFERAVESMKAVRQDKTALLLQYSQSERKFRALFEQSALGAAVINLMTGRIEEVNDGLVRMVGFGRRQLADVRFSELLSESSRQHAEEWLRHVRQHGDGTFTARLGTSSGSDLVTIISCRALRLGESLVMAAYFIDITAKERAEAQIKTQLARVTALSELSQGLMTTLDRDAIFALLHEKVSTVVPFDELIIAVNSEEEPGCFQIQLSAMVGEAGCKVSHEPALLEVDPSILSQLAAKDDSGALLLSRGDRPAVRAAERNPALLKPGNFLASALIVPMTSRRHICGLVVIQSAAARAYDPSHIETLRALVAQVALALSNASAFASIREQEESLRVLNLQILTAQETERGRISRELHDGVGQQLTAMKYILEGIRSASKAGDGDKLNDNIADARELASQIIEELRSISLDLRPTMLDDLGLGPTLDWVTRQHTKRHRMPVELEHSLGGAEIPPEVATAVYRIIQEALGNIAKHSRAHSAIIRAAISGNDLIVEVIDDGIGFDISQLSQKQVSRGCSGLMNMKERARFHGGDFRLETAPGKGTKLKVTIPVKESN